MSQPQSDLLRVPGANLYYEVRGTGPVLLLIPPGGGDARAFDGIADKLADRYTVVAYDRRGLSRSKLDDPEQEQQVEAHSDDAHRLLEAITNEPAYVFGSSGGAAIALDLASRHPEQVQMVIAHEPPSHLIPEEEHRHEQAQELFRREGAGPALGQMLARMGIAAYQTDKEPDVELPTERPVANTVFLMKHEMPMYDRYDFDFDALAQAATQARIVLAGGTAQREAFPYRSAAAIAERLGTSLVEFPGGHAGYVTHPKAFTAKLLEVLVES